MSGESFLASWSSLTHFRQFHSKPNYFKTTIFTQNLKKIKTKFWLARAFLDIQSITCNHCMKRSLCMQSLNPLRWIWFWIFHDLQWFAFVISRHGVQVPLKPSSYWHSVLPPHGVCLLQNWAPTWVTFWASGPGEFSESLIGCWKTGLGVGFVTVTGFNGFIYWAGELYWGKYGRWVW